MQRGRRSRQAPVAPSLRAASATTAGIPSGPGTPPAPRTPTAPGTSTAASSAPSSDSRVGIDGADTRPERPIDVHQCANAGSIPESASVSAENGRPSMPRNRGTPGNAGQAIERGVERLKDFLAAEMQATHGPAEDRAHIATTGDRPSAGYNPCRTSTPAASVTPRCNPAARRRHAS